MNCNQKQRADASGPSRILGWLAGISLIAATSFSPPVQIHAQHVYEFPAARGGPQANTREELDAFGYVMESDGPAGTIAAAEDFAQRYSDSDLFPVVLLLEMKAEIAVNSWQGTVAVGHEILRRGPNNIEALILMAQVLPNVPRSNSARRVEILAEAEKDIEAAKLLLQNFHRPEGVPASGFIQNKRRLITSLREAEGYTNLVEGRYEEAVRNYKWVLADGVDPSPAVHLRLGIAYNKVGDKINARNQFQQAMQSNLEIIRKQASEMLIMIDGTK